MMLGNHPELHEGEIWLQNCTEEDFKFVPYNTKRLGRSAFYTDCFFEKCYYPPHIRPVFVQVSEMRKLNPENPALLLRKD